MNTLKKFNAPGYGRLDVMVRVCIGVIIIMMIAIAMTYANTTTIYEDDSKIETKTCYTENIQRQIQVSVTDNSPGIKSVDDQIAFYKQEILKLEKRRIELVATDKTPVYENYTDVSSSCYNRVRCKEGYFQSLNECIRLPINEELPKSGRGPTNPKSTTKVQPTKKLIKF